MPPLTAQQTQQLADVDDASPWLDEGPVYALLAHAASAAAAGAADGGFGGFDQLTAPAPEALRRDPDAHRGEPYRLEGRFARARRIPLSRRGPWGDSVTEWAILLDGGPREEVAVVWLVDPEGELPAPAVGQPVRLGARFYRIWPAVDLAGEPARFLTFVGSVSWVEPWGSVDQGPPAWAIVPLVVLLAGGLVAARLRVARQRRPVRRGRAVPAAEAASPDPAPPEGGKLPAEPAAALARLRHHRQRKGGRP